MKPEVQHMLTVLKTAIRVLGYTNRDVERKLGLSSSYLSRLFSGIIELRFEHLVDISQALGMELDEMLYFAYPYPKHPPTAGATRLRELVGTLPPPSAAAAQPAEAQPAMPTEEDIERMMAKTLRKMFGELARGQGE